MIVVAVALIDTTGRVLVQQRLPNAKMGGLWEFPGGKVEPGERCEAALRRELREELGIEVGALTPVGFVEEASSGLLLLLHRCETWRGEPRALQASALAWHHAEELVDLPMPPADRPLVGALIRARA